MVLSDPTRVNAFHEFLKQEHADENLAFFLAVEQFKQNESKDDEKRLMDSLFSTYIVRNAPRQVNLPSIVVEDLLLAQKNAKQTKEIFDSAQQEVLHMLRTNRSEKGFCFYFLHFLCLCLCFLLHDETLKRI
jgi:hypothetical protein